MQDEHAERRASSLTFPTALGDPPPPAPGRGEGAEDLPEDPVRCAATSDTSDVVPRAGLEPRAPPARGCGRAKPSFTQATAVPAESGHSSTPPLKLESRAVTSSTATLVPGDCVHSEHSRSSEWCTPRRTRKLVPSAVPFVPLLRNGYELLTHLGEDAEASCANPWTAPTPVDETQEWQQHPGTRNKVSKVITQLQDWYSDTVRPPVSDPALADDAESFKTALMYHAPTSSSQWGGCLSKLPAFWNRVALQRLRFQGGRHTYLVVHTVDGRHRLLVLEVPPEHMTAAESLVHAGRQMTFHDDLQGRFAPGLRLVDDFVDDMTPTERKFGEPYVTGGFPIHFTAVPERFQKANYASYDVEHADKSLADLHRQRQAGWLEGPLLYQPWVTSPQGALYDIEKKKFRPILDCTVSGLNPLIIPPTCDYDLLEDTLSHVRPGDYLSGFDLKDAFYLWPRLQAHCDYLGLAGPPQDGGIYRLRFSPMGLSDSPGIQAKMMRIFKRMLNDKLALKCTAQGLSAGAANVAGIFVDDGMQRHGRECTLQQMEEQYNEYVLLIEKLSRPGVGPVDSVKKQDWPAPQKVHIGHHVNPQTMSVSVTEERRLKNIGVIEDLVKEVEPDGTVGRRKWSSVTGKLQFTAKVVRGMQAQLSTAYEPIYDVKPRGERPPDLQDWSQRAQIRTNPSHVHALEQAKLLYSDPDNCTRRLYYAEDTDSSAFWEGKVHDTHEHLDNTSRTSRRIPVYTRDASGFAAGVWYQDSSHIHQFPEGQRAPNPCHVTTPSNS